MAITKAHIAERIYERIGFSKRDSAAFVDAVFELLKEGLERGNNVKISRFGTFVLHDKKQRRGRNPHTGEEMLIDGRRVLAFRASRSLKEAVNRRSRSR